MRFAFASLLDDIACGQTKLRNLVFSMSDAPSVPGQLREDAELVVKMFRNMADLKFDERSVEWVDGYIERVRDQFPQGSRDGLVGALAAFLGQCIIETYGGGWAEVDGHWGVRVSDQVVAFPFHNVEKQFQHGHEEGESVFGIFSTIPVLVQHFGERR